MDSSGSPEPTEPRVPSLHISTSVTDLRDEEGVGSPGTPGLLATEHRESGDGAAEEGAGVTGQAPQADGYERTPSKEAEGRPVSEDRQEMAAPDAAGLSEDAGQAAEAPARAAEESMEEPPVETNKPSSPIADGAESQPQVQETAAEPPFESNEPSSAVADGAGESQPEAQEPPVETNDPSSATAEDAGESPLQAQGSGEEPPVESNEPQSASIAEEWESHPEAPEANELHQPLHEPASPALHGLENNEEAHSDSPAESSEQPLDSRPARPASGGPPLSGPTLFPGPLPTIEASGTVVDEGKGLIVQDGAQQQHFAPGLEPTAIPEAQIRELMQAAALEDGAQGAPSSRSRFSSTNRSSVGRLVDAMASDLPPEIAMYLGEFEQWLQMNFGYGRNSASESEALERSLQAGRDVPGAVRVPFLARRYYSRPSARQQLATQRQMQGSAEAPEPLWGDEGSARPRPTQGWRPASGRLAPMSRPAMRMCDVETSLRPTNPEYFQDTYEALLGRQHRSISIRDARLRESQQPILGNSRRMAVLAGEVPDALPAKQTDADILDVTKDNGRGEDRPGTPLSFLYTKDLDDESVKAKRIESANADMVELALKGKLIKPEKRASMAEKAISGTGIPPGHKSRPLTPGSRPRTAPSRPGTNDKSRLGSALQPNLGRRHSELTAMAGPLDSILGNSFRGLTPDALAWKLPTLEAMTGAGNVSMRSETEEDCMPVEDAEAVLRMLRKWPNPGRPWAVANLLADLMQPLPFFFWMEARLRPFLCQQLTFETHRSNDILYRIDEPVHSMAVVLQGSIVLHDLLEPMMSLDESAGEGEGAKHEQREGGKLDTDDVAGGKIERKEEEGEPVHPEDAAQEALNGPADSLGTLPDLDSYDAWVEEHATPRSSTSTRHTPPALIPTTSEDALGPEEGVSADSGADMDEGRSKPYNNEHRTSYDAWLDENATGDISRALASVEEEGSEEDGLQSEKSHSVLEHQEKIITLRPGEVVGSMYLASRKPMPAENTAQMHTTKVVGDKNVELATLSRQVFDLCRLQVASMLVMQKFPALTKLHNETQQDIIDDLDLKMVEPGRVILKEGDRGARFFVIISGHAVVTITDPIETTERDANADEEATEFPEAATNAGAENVEMDGGNYGEPEGNPTETHDGSSGIEPSDKDTPIVAKAEERNGGTEPSSEEKPSVAIPQGGNDVVEASDKDKPGVAATSATDQHDKDPEGGAPFSPPRSPPATSNSGNPPSAGSSRALARLMSHRTVSRTESSRFKVGDSVFSGVLAGAASVKKIKDLAAAQGKGPMEVPPEVKEQLDAVGQLVVRVIGPGSCFGELALLLDGTRSASVIALTPVEIISLDKSSYLQLLAGMHSMSSVGPQNNLSPRQNPSSDQHNIPKWPAQAAMLRRLLSTPPGARKHSAVVALATAFNSLKFFNHLPWLSAMDICQFGTYRHQKSGETISVRPTSNTMHVLLNGSVRLIHKRKREEVTGTAEVKTLAVFIAGDRFGHLGLLEGSSGFPEDMTLNMSCVCDTECELLAIDRHIYNRFLLKDDLRSLKVTVDYLTKVPPFNALPRRRLLILAALAAVRTVPRGEILLDQGEAPSDVHIIRQGEARVSMKIEEHVRSIRGGSLDVVALGEGDHIGLGALLPKKSTPMIGQLTAETQLEVMSIEIGKLTEQLKQSGAKAHGSFLHMASRQEAMFKERVAKGLHSLAGRMQDVGDMLHNDAPVLKNLIANSMAALANLDSAGRATTGSAESAVSLVAGVTPAVPPINPPGGGHNDFRTQMVHLGAAAGIEGPRTDPAVSERFKKMDAERDFIQTLSQGTRMRRVGPQAVEVKVPLPADPDAKPVPGRVPKAKPLIDHEALAVDASVLPTRGTGELPAAVQYDAVLTHGTLSKLPNDVQTYPHDHYEKILPGEDAAADMVSPQASLRGVSEIQGKLTFAAGEKGIDASAGILSLEDTEGSSMDHAAIATLRSPWDSYEAYASLVSVTASNNVENSYNSLPKAIEGALSHEETLEHEASELESGANNSAAEPSQLLLSLPSQRFVKSPSALSRVPESPSPEGSNRATSPKRSRLGILGSPRELPLGVSEPSLVSTALPPLEESTQSVVQSPAPASAPAPAPVQPTQQPRGRIQRMQKTPQKAADEVGATARSLVKQDSKLSNSSRSSDDDSLVAALVGKRKLKLPTGPVKSWTGPAAERDRWIRNTYYQSVVVPTMPKHHVVRMDILAHSSEHPDYGKDGLYVKLPKTKPKEKHHELQECKKAFEQKKTEEEIEAAAQEEAKRKLHDSCKPPAGWRGFKDCHAKERESFLPPPPEPRAHYTWEMDNFSSEEGYTDGVMDEETGICFFN